MDQIIREAIAQADQAAADFEDWQYQRAQERERPADGGLVYKGYEPREHATTLQSQAAMTAEQQEPWDRWARTIAKQEAVAAAEDVAGMIGAEVGKLDRQMGDDLRAEIAARFDALESTIAELQSRIVELEQTSGSTGYLG